jgi:DNA replication protein DnaD
MKTIEVTKLEMQFLTTLVNLLNAEAGFSDVEIAEMAEEMNIRVPEAKGVMGSLVKKGLLEEPDADFGGIIYLANRAYNLHERWMEESNGFGVEQVSIIEK